MLSSLFGALSIRIIFSIFTSFLVAIIIAPGVIENLKTRQIGQNIREEGVQAHKKKAGIPTMGGVIILVPVIITTLLWARFNLLVGLVLFATLGMGFIGIMDDLTKVIKSRSLGLTPKQKLFCQLTIALVISLVILFHQNLRFEMILPPSEGSTRVSVAASATQLPFYGVFDLGWFFIPFVLLVIVGSTNAVNLTDGLDGLATGTLTAAVLPFLIMTYITGNHIFAQHLGVLYISGAGELAVICATLLGGCLGFLWFNTHPAEVFMGDTGSLALGGAVGALSVCIKSEVFLAIVGGIFVLEALSVIIQVSYFKFSHGQRIFKMSPIHHHFELSGWAEEKVVIRFWVITLMLSLMGLVLFASHLVSV